MLLFQEKILEDRIYRQADIAAACMKKYAPQAFQNMTKHKNPSCRIGYSKEQPFSGSTMTLDYAAHHHRDVGNMMGGATAITTLIPNKRKKNKRETSLHVLSSYSLDGSTPGVAIDLPAGSLCLEVSREEYHGSTRVAHPWRFTPSRIAVVFYQGNLLNYKNHGRK